MHYIPTVSFFNSVYYAMCLYCIHGIISYYTKRNRSKECLQYFLDIISLYCLATIITSRFPLYTDTSGLKIYLFGNKFTSNYVIFSFLGLFYSLYGGKIKKNIAWRAMYFILVLTAMIYARLVDCSTAIVSDLVFLIFCFPIDVVKKITMSPKVVFGTVVFTSAFPVLMSYIIRLKFVQHIIVNILGESLTINYRNVIYNSYLFPLISNSLIFGYGYGNTMLAEKTNYAFGNAQNGLMDIVLKYGIIGATAIVFTIIYCYTKSAKTPFNEGVSLLVYAILIAGMIEVTYSWFLLLGLFLVKLIDEKSVSVLSIKKSHYKFIIKLKKARFQ